MATGSVHSASRAVWGLARNQHWVVARRQLLELGLSAAAIRHRVATGRLHPVMREVYAVGRPELGNHGRWMAAVLRCGPNAVLSHESAAAAWGMRAGRAGKIAISVCGDGRPRAVGIRVHRRAKMPRGRLARVAGIPVTDPALTLVDIAPRLPPGGLDAAVNEADKLDLVDPDSLRRAVDELPGIRGVAVLRRCLDRSTFVLTDSQLERRFLPIADAAGLPRPHTQQRLNGFKVDFFWPELGLVVETDGLRYHRTPAQQARDRRRDQAHARVGMTPLRFTHAQIRYEPAAVKTTLAVVARRLASARRLPSHPRLDI